MNDDHDAPASSTQSRLCGYRETLRRDKARREEAATKLETQERYDASYHWICFNQFPLNAWRFAENLIFAEGSADAPFFKKVIIMLRAERGASTSGWLIFDKKPAYLKALPNEIPLIHGIAPWIKKREQNRSDENPERISHRSYIKTCSRTCVAHFN